MSILQHHVWPCRVRDRGTQAQDERSSLGEALESRFLGKSLALSGNCLTSFGVVFRAARSCRVYRKVLNKLFCVGNSQQRPMSDK